MRSILGVAAALVGAASAAAADPTAGKWQIVSLVRDGKSDDSMNGSVRTHDATTYEIARKSAPPIKGTYEYDEKASPMTVDMKPSGGHYKGQVLRGIFKVEGDTWTICFADKPDKPRPTEFKGADGYVLVVHKKVK